MIDRVKLWETMRYHWLELRSYRLQEHDAIREYLGPFFGNPSGTKLATPFNGLRMIVDTLCTYLVSRHPQLNISTDSPELRPVAKRIEYGLNRRLEQMKLARPLNMCTKEALMSLGVALVGREPTKYIEYGGEQLIIGQTFVDQIPLEDWVGDSWAPRFEDMSFAGHKFILPLSYIQGCGLYDPEIVGKLTPGTRYTTQPFTGEQKVQGEAAMQKADPNEILEFVELWNVWLPSESRIVTFAGQNGGDEGQVVRDVEWVGPSTGPYHYLYFQRAPGTLMPAPPVDLWRDMHDLLNNVWNKVSQQIKRQKTVGIAQSGKELEAQRLMSAADGDVVAMDAGAIQGFNVPGMDASLGNAARVVRELLLGVLGGNVEALAGLGPCAPTLGQDRLIHASASQNVNYLGSCVEDFAACIMRDIAWYAMTDPLVDLSTCQTFGPAQTPVHIKLTAAELRGDFLDYNFTCKPYSMQYQTPDGELEKLNSFVMQILTPLTPVIQQQGGVLNVQQMLQMYMQRLQIPELSELVTFPNQQPEPRQEPIGQPPAKVADMARPQAPTPPANPAPQGRPPTATSAPESEFSNFTGSPNVKTQPMMTEMA
jgi:hypothetical protein